MKRIPGTICRREMQEGNKAEETCSESEIIEHGGTNHWTRIPEKGCWTQRRKEAVQHPFSCISFFLLFLDFKVIFKAGY